MQGARRQLFGLLLIPRGCPSRNAGAVQLFGCLYWGPILCDTPSTGFHASSTLGIWHFWVFTHFTHFHPLSHFFFLIFTMDSHTLAFELG